MSGICSRCGANVALTTDGLLVDHYAIMQIRCLDSGCEPMSAVRIEAERREAEEWARRPRTVQVITGQPAKCALCPRMTGLRSYRRRGAFLGNRLCPGCTASLNREAA